MPQAPYLNKRKRREAQAGKWINRKLVWKRDKGVCGICGERANPFMWHLDHIVPISQGGAHTYENVQVSHPLCNLQKGAKKR